MAAVAAGIFGDDNYVSHMVLFFFFFSFILSFIFSNIQEKIPLKPVFFILKP